MSTKEDLENALIKAQIANLEKQNKYWVLKETLPAILAIIFSIVAAYVVILISDRVIDKTKSDLNHLNAEIDIKKTTYNNLSVKYNELNNFYNTLLGKTSLYDIGVKFKVDFEKVNNSILVHLTTDSKDIEFHAYQLCKNSFAFPDKVPNVLLCDEIEGEIIPDKNITHYTFGPFIITSLEEGIWLKAELKGKVVFKYVNLKLPLM
jgi:hypothetical protein